MSRQVHEAELISKPLSCLTGQLSATLANNATLSNADSALRMRGSLPGLHGLDYGEAAQVEL